MTHADLFSGIGGFSIAADAAGYRTILHCENADFPRRVLEKRFPHIPLHDDVKTLDPALIAGVDLLTAGPPCQPWSIAGDRKGSADDRDGWPATLALIERARPRWCCLENPLGFATMEDGLPRILSELARIGYVHRVLNLPAAGVGLWHRRERLFIVAADADRAGQLELQGSLPESGGRAHNSATELALAHTNCERLWTKEGHRPTHDLNRDTARAQGIRRYIECSALREHPLPLPAVGHYLEWPAQPFLGGAIDGVPRRVDRYRGRRLKALCNAVCPQQCYPILKAIRMQEEK